MPPPRPNPPESCLVKIGYILFFLLGLAVIGYFVRNEVSRREAAYRLWQAERFPPPGPAVWNWANLQGNIIRATFIRLEDDKVTLQKADGKPVTLPLDTLDAPSQKLARALAAGGLPGM